MPAGYTYHGLHHTDYVLNACEQYIVILGLSSHEECLLKTAALMHDIGLIWSYNDHEDASILYVKEVMPQWGFHEDDISQICKMIAATKIPQEPYDLLNR